MCMRVTPVSCWQITLLPFVSSALYTLVAVGSVVRAKLRAGMSGYMSELRAGVSGEIGELRAGVSGEMVEVRGEQGSLRGEMLLGFAELKSSQAQGLRTLFFANLASMATIAGLVLAAV